MHSLRDVKATDHYLEKQENNTIKVYRIFSKLVVSSLIWVKKEAHQQMLNKDRKGYLRRYEFPDTGSDQSWLMTS